MILDLLDRSFPPGRWSQEERYAKQRKGYTQNCRPLKEHGLLRESRKVGQSLKNDVGHAYGELCEDQTVESIWAMLKRLNLIMWTSQSQWQFLNQCCLRLISNTF